MLHNNFWRETDNLSTETDMKIFTMKKMGLLLLLDVALLTL